MRRLLLTLLIAAPVLPAADKSADKTLELLREVGGLQDQIKALQKELAGKLADLGQAAKEQARSTSEETAKAINGLGDRLQKGLQDQQDQQIKALAGIAALNSQLQEVAGEIGTMRQAMTDLTTDVIRLSAKMTDLTTAIKAAQTSNASQQVEISATDLWNSAEGDRHGGKFDLALKEYAEYVYRFGDSPQAADAQYYIGSIQYANEKWDEAAKAFDLFLQAAPDSSRVPEALYYKGDSLNRAGHATEAADVFRDLRKRFANHPLAKKSLTVKLAK